MFYEYIRVQLVYAMFVEVVREERLLKKEQKLLITSIQIFLLTLIRLVRVFKIK